VTKKPSQATRTIAGTTAGAFYYRATSSTNTIDAGLYLNTSVPCYVVADSLSSTDELVIFGA
jgi:hypothetical protein